MGIAILEGIGTFFTGPKNILNGGSRENKYGSIVVTIARYSFKNTTTAAVLLKLIFREFQTTCHFLLLYKPE
jgi:hypothetical protein